MNDDMAINSAPASFLVCNYGKIEKLEGPRAVEETRERKKPIWP